MALVHVTSLNPADVQSPVEGETSLVRECAEAREREGERQRERVIERERNIARTSESGRQTVREIEKRGVPLQFFPLQRSLAFTG